MRFAQEFRDGDLGRALAAELPALVEPGRAYKLMEVCGGHTHTIYRYGIEALLPDGVELVHGPGCPVCVLPMGRVDDGIAIARQPGVILTCFGDMMRVPGSQGSLQEARSLGADVRMVYSPLDALRIARENPDREVVFFALGFETTAPSTALTLMRARREGVRNFSCLCNHVLIEPPLRALLDAPGLQVDGFIGPGHVATVIGARAFGFIPRDYGRPVVVSGFEPLDVHAVDPDAARTAGIAPLRGREPVPAGRLLGGQPAGTGGDGRGLLAAASTSSGAGSAASRTAPCGSPRSTPHSTPSTASRCPGRSWPIRASASAAMSSEARSSLGSAGSSALRAPPSGRSARAWSPPRGPVRPTTATAATSPSARRREPMSADTRRQRVAEIVQTARSKRPRMRDERITMAHGAGGRSSQALIEGLLVPALGERSAWNGWPMPARWWWATPRSPSRPTASWSGRCASRAARSASWRSTGQSTTWPSRAPGRSR